MKQIVQNMGTGETALIEAPAPVVQPGTLLIQTTHSLISAGTERMLVDFGRSGWLEKARKQPDRVRMVLDKIRTEGLFTTLDAVKSKLDQPLPLGYCNAGVVIEVGAGVRGFAVGDRVVSNGAHADLVRVPQNLCARIPDGVGGDEAAYVVLASIGLQGIRLAAPTIGESVAVIGLGLIGLLTVQLLRANGCHVIGIDVDGSKVARARAYGATGCDVGSGEDPVAVALAATGGRGVDAVLITASTASSEPVGQAARMSRKRGRIVLVGVTGLELNRAEFYEKELSFQVSCSYGPGRYDPSYEQRGHDYPLAFVRWTEQRNFEAVLGLMAAGQINVDDLTTHRFPFDDCVPAYDLLTSKEPVLGIVIEYPQHPSSQTLLRTVDLHPAALASAPSDSRISVIGAGNYASRVLIPALKKAGAMLDTLANSGGVSGAHHGVKQGFARVTTDVDSLFDKGGAGTVVIATRHDSHAEYAIRALEAGKAVFVEKPLALTLEELDRVVAARDVALAAGSRAHLMVGFNRRFSPLVRQLKGLLDVVPAPKAFIYTVNAGAIPSDHWTQDRQVGGGRIIGEACHFIDLLRFLCGTRIVEFSIHTLGGSSVQVKDDKAMISLVFEDGSIGTIHYLANGGKAFPKERLEVFANDAVLVLDNFLSLEGFGWRGFNKQRLWRQDKGQTACASAFLESVRTGTQAPIPFAELEEVSRVAIELAMAQAA